MISVLVSCLLVLWLGVASVVRPQASAPVSKSSITEPRTFTNPLTSRDAADPWIIFHDGYYYFTATTGRDIFVQKSRTITGIDGVPRVTVWKPPATGPQSRSIWAPELHFLSGKWYIYYAADDSKNENHRMYVLEAASADPQGAYLDRGKIYDRESDKWAIDGTVLQKSDGALYFIWSGWEGDVDKVAQNLYIAPMANPWTIAGARVLISRPEQAWEGWINEGPQVLQREGKTFIIYSASGSWTPDYKLGMLMNTTGDVLDPKAWTKSVDPVFTRQPAVFGPGHNSFTRSPDGTEDWIVYHATTRPTDGWRNRRPRAQEFTWNPDGTPNFGYPVAPGVPLTVPSGEPGSSFVLPANVSGTGTGLRGEYYDDADFTNLKSTRTDRTINYAWGLIEGNGAPAPLMHPDAFSVRWQGQIEPRYSETYTFNTYSDDGVRVWIDGKLLIDAWTPHTAQVHSGMIKLEAGRRYPVRIDYYDDVESAIVRLEWSSRSQPLEVVPAMHLYPAAAQTSSRYK